MGWDRSPQRVKMSVLKQQVRYYHRIQTYRKSRSERTTRRKKKIRIKVDVSQPPYPYEEPMCYVKLAVHHRVAAYYTGSVLRCDKTSYCNELCDYVCGGMIENKNMNEIQSEEALDPVRPKSLSCDSGFCDYEPDSPTSLLDNEFVNVDIKHKSVWFCRQPPMNQQIVISSLYPHSESATETECTGPSNTLCYRWHKDLQKSAAAVKKKKMGNSEVNSRKNQVLLKNLGDSGPVTSTPKMLHKTHPSSLPIAVKAKSRRIQQIQNIKFEKKNNSSNLEKFSMSTDDSLHKTNDFNISDYDSTRGIVNTGSDFDLKKTYAPVLTAIENTSRDRKTGRRTSSFRVDV